MSGVIIDTDIVSVNDTNIHSDMLILANKLNQLFTKCQVSTYTKPSDIYLKSDSTLEDIHKNLPISGAFKCYMRGSEYKNIMPRLAKGKDPAIGTLCAIKMDVSSTMFTYDAYGFCGVCYYNQYESKKISDWMITPQRGFWHLGSDFFGNDISNIIYSGLYRFETNSFPSFPTTEPCVLSVYYDTEFRKHYRITRSGGPNIYEWTSYNGTVWAQVPTVFTHNPSAADLRIGDMLIDGNGDLAIKVNSTTVKTL